MKIIFDSFLLGVIIFITIIIICLFFSFYDWILNKIILIIRKVVRWIVKLKNR